MKLNNVKVVDTSPGCTHVAYMLGWHLIWLYTRSLHIMLTPELAVHT